MQKKRFELFNNNDKCKKVNKYLEKKNRLNKTLKIN